MTRRLKESLDFEKNPIQNVVLENLATDPVTGASGQLIYNSTSNTVKYNNGTNFVDIGGGGGGGDVNTILQPTIAPVKDQPANNDSIATINNKNLGLINTGASLAPVVLSNFATNSVIGLASATVDVNKVFLINQTTAGITLTLPTPTNAALAQTITVVANSTASFTMYGITIQPNTSQSYLWTGSAWTLEGAILNTVDYLYVIKTTATTLTGNTDIIFNSIQGGGIPFNTTTGVATLTANKTYTLRTNAMQSSANLQGNYQFVDATTNLSISASAGTSSSGTSLNGDGFLEIIYTPLTNQTIKVRTFATSAGTVLANRFWMSITQIGSSATTTFAGATASTNGTNGAVPQPIAGQQNSFLRADATWQPVYGTFFGAVAYGVAANITAPALNTPINLSTFIYTAGNTSFQTNASGVITLQPGFDYFLEAMLVHGAVSTGSNVFTFRVNGTQVNGIGGSAVAASNTSTTIGVSSIAHHIFSIATGTLAQNINIEMIGTTNTAVRVGGTTEPKSYLRIIAFKK